MAILNINDFIENDDECAFELNGKKYPIDASFKALLAYDNLLKKFSDGEIEQIEFASNFMGIVLGSKEKYKLFQKELNEISKSLKQRDKILETIIKIWLHEAGLESVNSEEPKKK